MSSVIYVMAVVVFAVQCYEIVTWCYIRDNSV